MDKDRDNADFDALDACHRQTLQHLCELEELATQLDDASLAAQVHGRADLIDRFFSDVSRAHHAEEETTVFPPLLASGDAELVHAVQTLQQDHGWIERNWDALGPQLRAIAKGESWPDPAEFQHGVKLFVNLCREHIALEETLIYPQSKARWARVVAQRRPRAKL